MTALSELLVTANKAGLSARAVARAAQERGHSLNHDTAARYLRGDHGVPDEATLIALSDVLGVSMKALRAAADLPSESTSPYVPPLEAGRLTRRQRRAVDEIIRAMVEPTRTRSGDDELAVRRGRQPGRTGSKSGSPSGRRSGGRAARRGTPEPPAED